METKEYLEKLAADEAWCDDDNFLVDDFAGGNEDDAYHGGYRDGQIKLAREILECARIALSEELKTLVKEFFAYLDTVEESDSGHEFRPLQFTCCRSTMTPKVEACLERMKELACK